MRPSENREVSGADRNQRVEQKRCSTLYSFGDNLLKIMMIIFSSQDSWPVAISI